MAHEQEPPGAGGGVFFSICRVVKPIEDVGTPSLRIAPMDSANRLQIDVSRHATAHRHSAPGHSAPEYRAPQPEAALPKTPSRAAQGRSYLGGWELVRVLGEGEWATVHAGRPRDCEDDQPLDYAIKVARLDGGKQRQAEQLFAREALIGRTVTHPHLMAVLSTHTGSSPAYIVMPLMQGATLDAALLQCGRFAVPHALWIVRQVAEALAALHRAGWMHADVKPSNICLTRTGHATLIDLGFALKLDSPECAAGSSLRGTLTYTAPEMISSAVPSSAHCDIYSLGISLYELLIGRPPFADAEPGSLMLSHLQRPVPNPRHVLPTLHRDIWQLLQDMLAKEPLRRPCAEELVQRLVDLEIATLEQRVA